MLHPRVESEYKKMLAARDERSIKRQKSLARYFGRFCDMERHLLQPEQFKHQGSFQTGQNKVAIWEFKAWQFRIYGATLIVEGKQCFVGVRVDPEKKQDDADADLLELAAADIAALAEFNPAKSKKVK